MTDGFQRAQYESKELRREIPDPTYPDYPPELEYSRESAASGKKHLVRLVVATADGFAEIKDACVSSHGPRFKMLPDRGNGRVGLTLTEARWLLDRLPEIVERLEQHHALDAAELKRLREERVLDGPAEASGA